MKNSKYFLFIAVIIVVGIVFFLVNKFSVSDSKNSQKPFDGKLTNNSNNMKITSPAFENNGNIPSKYTCDETGINPPLEFSGVPADALSLALVLHDPDAPVPGGFTHWIIFNMDPKTAGTKENSKPESGIEGTNSDGKAGYASPCPPSGTHHYHFTLYALDEKLKFDESAKRSDIEKAIAGHIIEQAELVGLYQRK